VPDLCTYSYTIIRVVPRVEREEFVNVGVIVSCPARRFLEAHIALDEQRVKALDASLDIESLRAHLATISTICVGGKPAGPIGELSQRERFYWLSAPRSTIIQASPVHTGLCHDPAVALTHLLNTMVRPPRGDESPQTDGVEKKGSAMRLLAISGSLRAASANTTLLRAAAALAPEGVEVHVYAGLGDLPHFNPDIEDVAPPVVKNFSAQVGATDGIIISTPEYAHGIPGVLKNALDWLVGGFDFMNKPVALFNASPRSTYATASLTEILTIMSGRIVPEASIAIPLRELQLLDEAHIVAHAEIADVIRKALMTFTEAIARMKAES
jgi:chromate reductase, NAD(P)H dehydrogenase (quinone)